jgi:Bifunctional DNA primase/polymerase, N-terminal/Primase C terminal 1 (PriCT-1)
MALVDRTGRPNWTPLRALGGVSLAPGKPASAFKSSAVSILLPTQSFRDWQPLYAAHGIPTFPVQIGPDTKKPMVSNYGRFGLRGSGEIAEKFPDATAIGFMVGRRTGLTILDVDTPDERVLADALDRYGPTPVIVRSGSGNRQAWYRNNGEDRLIRNFEPGKPIDLLGGGFVVAPPSRGIKGAYQFIEGGLDDLECLPIMQNIRIASPPLSPASNPVERVAEGSRNNSLWEQCMREAHHCDDFDALLDVARTYNEALLTPLPVTEVVKTAKSAWDKTQVGENWFGQTGVRLSTSEVNHLISGNPDDLVLLAFLQANNGRRKPFMVANGLKDKFGWTRKRLAGARGRLADSHLEMVRRPSKHNGPALYRWRSRAR